VKKRGFFLASLPLAAMALLTQAAGFYFVFLAVAEAAGWMQALYMPPFMFVAQTSPQPTNHLGSIAATLLLSGLVLAVLSLSSVIVSFRRHEGGWRFISIILLTVYLGTWLFVLHGLYS